MNRLEVNVDVLEVGVDASKVGADMLEVGMDSSEVGSQHVGWRHGRRQQGQFGR